MNEINSSPQKKRIFRKDSFNKVEKIFSEETNPEKKFSIMFELVLAANEKNKEKLNEYLKTLKNLIPKTKNPTYYNRFFINLSTKINNNSTKNFLNNQKNPLLAITQLTTNAVSNILHSFGNNWKELIQHFENSKDNKNFGIFNTFNILSIKNNVYQKTLLYFKQAENLVKSIQNKDSAYQILANANFGIDKNEIFRHISKIQNINIKISTYLNIAKRYLEYSSMKYTCEKDIFYRTGSDFLRKAYINIPYTEKRFQSFFQEEVLNTSTENHVPLV